MTSISDTEVVNAPGGLVELGYKENPGLITVDTTATGASGTLVIDDLTVVCDGSPIIVEFFSPSARPPNTLDDSVYVTLMMDGAEQARNWIEITSTSTTASDYDPIHAVFRMTPSAGSHTFSVRARNTGGSSAARIGRIQLGSSGTGAATGYAPGFLRVSKIIQASQLLVTQSNAPIVTSLPSGNLVTGQEVHLYSSSPAGYQKQFWDGTQWNLMGDSRPVPSVRAVRSTTDTGFTGFKNIQWNAADAWDTDNLHDPSTNADRITFTRSGIYIVTLAIYLDYTGSPSYADCRIKGNNTTVLAEDYRIPAAGSYLTTLTAHVNTTSYSYVVADAVISGATSATLRGDVANMCWFSATYLGKN